MIGSQRDQNPAATAANEAAMAALAGTRIGGIASATRLATETGWHAARDVTVGDHVMTFDDGFQMVTAVTRSTHFLAHDMLPALARPIDVPIGAIGNDEPMVLLPESHVVVESEMAEMLFGDPFALVPARVLVGFRGCERFKALRPVEVVTLHMERDEVIVADGGGLLYAPAMVPGLSAEDERGGARCGTCYTPLPEAAARKLIAAMAQEDARAFAQSARLAVA